MRQERADDDVELEGLVEVGADGIHGDAALAAAALDGCAAGDHRHRGEHVRRALERFGILERERPHGVQHAGRETERARLAGLHLDRRRAELRELLDHVGVQAFADRGQQHDGRDADADAERRQHAAQPMRDDGLADQPHEVLLPHRFTAS